MPDYSEYLRNLARAEGYTGSARWPAAAVAWQQVVEGNPVNGSHWARLAEARFELGDCRGALAAYGKAEENGVWSRTDEIEATFPAEIAYRIAGCHARLGDHESAVRELGRALRLGFRDLDRPRTDEHWAAHRGDDAVREMLGIIDTGGLTRDDGWRADLAFLAREVKRRVRAFRAMPEAEFDAAVEQLGQDLPELSDLQIVARMMKLLRPLGDGHAFVLPADQEQQPKLPVQFYLFDEEVFITAAAEGHQELLGARVLKVGDVGVSDALAAIGQLLSRDNSQQVRRLSPEVLRWAPLLHAIGVITDPGEAVLTVRFPDGATGQVTVTAAGPGPHDYPNVGSWPGPTGPRPAGWISLCDTVGGPLPLYLRNCDLLYWFEHLPEHGLVYFQFNSVADQQPETFAAFCERLFAFIGSHAVSKLVLDVRWNGGGNTFLTQQLLHHLIRCTQVNQPGRLFVIIGRATFSAAQNTATAIERETSAIFVGEPTGSRPNFIGETIPFQLPYSKTEVNVADLYWQTSWPNDHRPWIAPELYAPPTFEAYRQNRDPAMEAILACHEHLPGC
jgi:tetratricopeptide (TPR) repeat protein